MKVYMFDVDETLEFSGGPIRMRDVNYLVERRDSIVGLCGNWAAVPRVFYGNPFSFIGPMEMTKEAFLSQIKQHVKADEYIMVGNIFGVTGGSDDKGAAERAGWDFIAEYEFAGGKVSV